MPGGLVPDGLLKHGLHFFPVQALDGVFIRGMKTGLQLSVSSEPQPVAFAAEMGADGTDETDIALGSGRR